MRLPFNGTFPLTQSFGLNPQYYTQFLVKQPDGTTAPMKGHNGQDYGLPSGTEVVAPHHGKIIEAAFDEKGYGNYIKIENNEEGSVLAHLEKIDVVVGQEMNEGDHLATSDNTGYSTGAHLHWGYYRKPRDRANGYAGFVDQTPFISKDITEPVSGKLHTDEEYQACMMDRDKFWKERDELIAASEELRKQLQEKNEKLTAFAALGYATVEDVTKKVDELEKTNLGLQTQIKQVLDDNTALATIISKKEKQDSTAIDEGIKAQDKASELEKQLQIIARSVEAKKPEAKYIVSQFDTFKRLADWGEKMLRSKEKADTEARTQKNEQIKYSYFDIFLEFFGVNTKGGV